MTSEDIRTRMCLRGKDLPAGYGIICAQRAASSNFIKPEMNSCRRYGDTGAPAIAAASAPSALSSNMLQLRLTCTASNSTSVTKKLPSASLPIKKMHVFINSFGTGLAPTPLWVHCKRLHA